MAFRRENPPLFLKFLKAKSGGFDDLVKEVVNGFPFEVRIEPFGQFEVDLHIRSAIIHRNGLVDGLERHPPGAHAVFFQKGCRGQNHIRILGGGRQKVLPPRRNPVS